MRATLNWVIQTTKTKRRRKKDWRRKRERKKRKNLTKNYLATIPRMEAKRLSSSVARRQITARRMKFILQSR